MSDSKKLKLSGDSYRDGYRKSLLNCVLSAGPNPK